MTTRGSGSGSAMAAAGRRAEAQMAFYLRRAFADDASVRVLNNIRLERSGEAAQIDHIVVHRYGIVIIESKSVSTAVRVNANGEWERQAGRSWQGMPSPILQASRQGKLLQKLLRDNTESLLGTMLLGTLQTGFGHMALDVLVAVSDRGRIQRASRTTAPEAVKADQVADRIRSLLSKYRRMTSPLNFSPIDARDAPRTFSKREVHSITAFLRTRNLPLRGTG